jgi:hypothetical protein
MIKVALDFYPGLHGHFLEYVCNRYIFKVPYNKGQLFQSSGAVHTINTDIEYQKNKIVHRGHYSSFNNLYPDNTSHIIFIKHNPIYDVVLLTNIFYRCHVDAIKVDDFNVDEITKMHTAMMTDSSDLVEPKHNWYAKLMEKHFELVDKQPTADLPTFYFDYCNFFKLDSFLLELKKVAKFLNNTFSYDDSLAKLWSEFIDRNQGYQLYCTSDELFTKIVSNIDTAIPDDWKIHAYLNYKLSTIFDLYDVPALFGSEPYPSRTQKIYQIVKSHVDNFDNLH